MYNPSPTLQRIVEAIYTHKTPSGRVIKKSDRRNTVVKKVGDSWEEIPDSKLHPKSKHRSQKLYKSPGTRAKAAFRGKVTKFLHKITGTSKPTKGHRDYGDAIAVSRRKMNKKIIDKNRYPFLHTKDLKARQRERKIRRKIGRPEHT